MSIDAHNIQKITTELKCKTIKDITKGKDTIKLIDAIDVVARQIGYIENYEERLI